MKKSLLIIFTICVHSLMAQNYQNICTTGITLYKSSDTYIKAFRSDSLYPLGNNDTLFISYHTIRDNQNGTCLDTTNGSILGRKILKKHNGWFCFFNSANDTIQINTQAAINETWRFCDLPNNGYIQAKVTAIVNDSVLGMVDQVKIITLQAKNSSNADTSHLLNQRSIRLSQHYGLSRMLDVYYVPNDTVNYILAGKTQPPIGLQDLAWQQVYDFNVGDEFHYSGGDGWINSYYYSDLEIYHVLEKTSYGNDSVKYVMEYCRKDTTYIPKGSTTVHDTITMTYNFQQLANTNASWFTRLPEEFLNQDNIADFYKTNFAYGNRQTKSVRFAAYMMWSYSPGCWVYLGQPGCWEIFQHENHYSEGLGSTYYYEECYSNYMLTHTKWNYLEYFRKGSETWGTPVALDCWTLTSTEPQKEKNDRTIHIIPNPVETESKILFNTNGVNEELHFLLIDNMGRIVAQFYTETTSYTFNRTGLPNGLYILSVYDKAGFLRGRAKLIIL